MLLLLDLVWTFKLSIQHRQTFLLFRCAMASMLSGRTHQSWSEGEVWGGEGCWFRIRSPFPRKSGIPHFFHRFTQSRFLFFVFFGKQINVRCRFALSIDILNYTLVWRSGGKAERKKPSNLGPSSALGEKEKKSASGEAGLGKGKGGVFSPSPGHRWAPFARRYVSYLTPFFTFFPHC